MIIWPDNISQCNLPGFGQTLSGKTDSTKKKQLSLVNVDKLLKPST